MTRRAFLLLIVSLAVGIVAGLRLFASAFGEVGTFVHVILRHHLHDLSIADTEIDKFVRDLKRAQHVHDGPSKVALLALVWPLYTRAPWLVGAWAQRGLHTTEAFLVTRFLLSTDFFLNHESKTRPVRYVCLYDPYMNPNWRPCPEQG